MSSNVTNPIFLQTDACKAYTYPSGSNTVVPYKVVLRTGALASSGTLASGVIPDGISGSNTETGYFSLVKREITVVQVQPGQSIAYNAPLAANNAGSGNVRTGVPGTDFIIGKALDTSDGSGTNDVPHYVRVDLTL